MAVMGGFVAVPFPAVSAFPHWPRRTSAASPCENTLCLVQNSGVMHSLSPSQKSGCMSVFAYVDMPSFSPKRVLYLTYNPLK